VIFIAVGTPETADGSADLGPTMSVVDAIAAAANTKKYVVLKSTVPVGTYHKVKARFSERSKFPIEVVSNPEFLKEGAAIEDFLRPDRVVIGCASAEAEAVMRELYDPFLKNGNPLIVMDNTSAEMTKYAANAFLSIKISFINELALLADKLGADIHQVRKGFTSDRRINPAFFHPGVGFGGSCFPKDVKALVHTALAAGVHMDTVHAADVANDRQKLILFERMKEHFGDLRGKRIAMWGLAFKPRTDDVREAPALYLIEKLVAAGASVCAFDPIAMETARAACNAPFETASSANEALAGADALAIVTEWNEFRSPDLTDLKARLKQAVIFDGRNVLDPVKVVAAGFKYFCIGRQSVPALARGEKV
jgi:UDPglucose 6-dehydrogenase